MHIKIKNLSLKYRNNKKNALDNVNLNIPVGIYGLVGENGAGKSTLLKILATQLPIEKGSVYFDSLNVKKDYIKIRKILGYLPQEMGFFENLTVWDMLDYIALIKNVKDEKSRTLQIGDLLNKFNLEDKANAKIKALSGGMKRRLGIAQCFLGDSKIIILDEPTVGLDPTERLRFRNIINDEAKDKIIILSTHIISDVSMLCENLGIIKKGHVLYDGSTASLLQKIERKISIKVIPSDIMIKQIEEDHIISINRKKECLEIRYIDELSRGKIVEPTLEDAYFYMMYERNSK